VFHADRVFPARFRPALVPLLHQLLFLAQLLRTVLNISQQIQDFGLFDWRHLTLLPGLMETVLNGSELFDLLPIVKFTHL
jgi:hypothetical protein